MVVFVGEPSVRPGREPHVAERPVVVEVVGIPPIQRICPPPRNAREVVAEILQASRRVVAMVAALHNRVVAVALDEADEPSEVVVVELMRPPQNRGRVVADEGVLAHHVQPSVARVEVVEHRVLGRGRGHAVAVKHAGDASEVVEIERDGSQ